jgi:excisionase family DNA binding protein
MSAIWSALLTELDDETLDVLAARLAHRIVRDDSSGDVGYLTPSTAARYLGVSRKRVYDLRSMGALEPDGYDGRTPLYSRATLDAYVRAA